MVGGVDNRISESPLANTMKGLPETMVTYSNHETTSDEDRALAGRMREEGVVVYEDTQDFLPHVFCLVSHLPESIVCQGRIVEFLKEGYRKVEKLE